MIDKVCKISKYSFKSFNLINVIITEKQVFDKYFSRIMLFEYSSYHEDGILRSRKFFKGAYKESIKGASKNFNGDYFHDYYATVATMEDFEEFLTFGTNDNTKGKLTQNEIDMCNFFLNKKEEKETYVIIHTIDPKNKKEKIDSFKETMDHELAHCFYANSKSYKKSVNKIIKNISPIFRRDIRYYLFDVKKYDNMPDVYEDEAQAFMIDGTFINFDFKKEKLRGTKTKLFKNIKKSDFYAIKAVQAEFEFFKRKEKL